MGLLLEFLAGPPDKMLEAFSKSDYDVLERLIEKRADFSLHLYPNDLETLFDCAADYVSGVLKPFRASLTCCLDDKEQGFFTVNGDWVDSIASVGLDKSDEIAEKWFEKMRKNYPEESIGAPSPEARKAVRDMLELCKYASKFKKSVIHIWSL